jgi:hypothetical protein
VRRQHVDDLAFAFVAPLRAQNCNVRFHPTVDLTMKVAKIMKATNEYTREIHTFFPFPIFVTIVVPT